MSAPGFKLKLSLLLDRTVFGGLLAIAVIATIPYGSVDPWWEAFFECAVFVLAGLWIFEVLLRGSWQIKKLWVIAPMFCLTAYAFVQTIQLPGLSGGSSASSIAQHTLTIDRYQTHLTAVKALALALFAGLLLLHTSTPQRFRWLVRTVVGIGVGSAMFGVIRQLLQTPSSPTGFGLPFLYFGVGYGQFISANVFSYLMEMVLGVIVGLILGRGVRRQLIFVYLAAGFVVWVALVWSNSRAGIVALLCQSIFLIFVAFSWYSERRLSHEGATHHRVLSFIRSSRLVRVVTVLMIAAVLVAGVLWIGGDRLAGKQISTRDDLIDGTTRKDIWSSSWQVIKHHPWTGVGFGAFFLAVPEYHVGSGRLKVAQAHNDYLDLAASGGIIAVVLAAWFVGMVIWRARHSFRSPCQYRRAVGLGATSGMLSVGVHSLFDFGLQVTGIAVVFSVLAVLVVADSSVETVRPDRGRRHSRPEE